MTSKISWHFKIYMYNIFFVFLFRKLLHAPRTVFYNISYNLGIHCTKGLQDFSCLFLPITHYVIILGGFFKLFATQNSRKLQYASKYNKKYFSIHLILTDKYI